MSWTIDRKPVSEEDFEIFLSSLKTVPGTWYCDDQEGGGATGLHARHPDGTVYAVVHDVVEGHSITRIPT